MKLGVIGFGQAGGKITERLVEYDEKNKTGIVVDAIAVNSAKADLLGLDRISEDKKVLIGQTEVKGHGVGADNELGSKIAREDMGEITSKVSEFKSTDIDAFLIIAGLGGGTGSGGAPHLARELQKVYTEPVYGLGVLPSSEEGGIYSMNAARSLQSLVDSVDNLILFDNDAWRQTGETVGSGYKRMNDELITRIGVLFSAGEITGSQDVGESIVDSSEIINTFKSGGISSIGYASTEVDVDSGGLFSKLGFGGKSAGENMEEDVQATNRITSLTRKAVLGRLTQPANPESVERALVIVAGPKEYINRKGVENARTWVEQATNSMEVRGGDYPIKNTNQLAVVVLLSGITDSDRIKELQRVGVETKETMEELSKHSEADLKELIQDEDDELEPLF